MLYTLEKYHQWVSFYTQGWARDGTGQSRVFCILEWRNNRKNASNWILGLYGICVPWTVPGLSGIIGPKCRDLLSRRFLSRSRASCGFESRFRSKSRGFSGPGSRQCPGTTAHPCSYIKLNLWSTVRLNMKTCQKKLFIYPTTSISYAAYELKFIF